MKKRTKQDPIRQRIAKKRHERELRRRSKRYTLSQSPRNSQIANIFKGEVITAPSTISIYDFFNAEGPDHYSPTIGFVQKIGSCFGKKKCVFDFSATTRITAAALIVVYAALENARDNGDKVSTIIWPKNSPAVARSLKRNGIPLLLENKPVFPKFANVEYLPVISSSGSAYMEDIVDHIQEGIYKNAMSPETEYYYGDAVAETINNVGLHAYPRASSSSGKRWWLLCEVHGTSVYLAIYDTGVGIPKTVIDKPWFLASLETVFPSDYTELLKQYPELRETGWKAYVPIKIEDSRLIALSMLGDVTGTRKSKHGQGSKSIKALINETNNGKLWIFSNNGLYTFENDEGADEIYKLPKTFPGTLIQWNISLT